MMHCLSKLLSNVTLPAFVWCVLQEHLALFILCVIMHWAIP